MNYKNPELQDKLAAEYVLGTLRGGARLRFQRLMQYDPHLRSSVAQWEERIYPLAEASPDINPPARVWNAIKARIMGTPAKASGSIGFWRMLGLFSSGLAAALLIYLSVVPSQEAPPTYVALLNDQKTQQPISMVSAKQNSKFLSVKMLEPESIPADKALELWALPEQGAPPMPLGLVAASGVTTLQLQQPASKQLGNVAAIAISLEPKGGSPTGLPTGPVLYVGKWLRL